MTLVCQSQPFRSAAGNSHGLHGCLDALHYGTSRHDEASNNHIFEGASVILKGLLACIESEAKIAISEVFGLGKTGAENVLNNGRFGKQMLHDLPSPEPLVDLVPKREKHASDMRASSLSRQVSGCSPRVTKRGFLITTRGKSFPQIAGKSARHGIRQNQPVDDSMLVGMRNPGNEPDLTINALDIDAGCEHVGNYHGFSQGRVIFTGHNNHPNSLLEPSSTAANSRTGFPSRCPSGAQPHGAAQ